MAAPQLHYLSKINVVHFWWGGVGVELALPPQVSRGEGGVRKARLPTAEFCIEWKREWRSKPSFIW